MYLSMLPIVCGEVNAERRYHGGDKSKPNDEDRVKWAKHFGYVDSLDAAEACFAIDSFRTIMVKFKQQMS